MNVPFISFFCLLVQKHNRQKNLALADFSPKKKKKENLIFNSVKWKHLYRSSQVNY